MIKLRSVSGAPVGATGSVSGPGHAAPGIGARPPGKWVVRTMAGPWCPSASATPWSYHGW